MENDIPDFSAPLPVKKDWAEAALRPFGNVAGDDDNFEAPSMSSMQRPVALDNPLMQSDDDPAGRIVNYYNSLYDPDPDHSPSEDMAARQQHLGSFARHYPEGSPVRTRIAELSGLPYLQPALPSLQLNRRRLI